MTVPLGRDVVVIVSVAALTVNVRARVTEWNAPSCSWKSWLVVPKLPTDGEPLISPVVAFSTKPSGSAGVTSQV